MASLNSRKVSLIAIMSAVSIVVAYSKGLALASLPGVIEFMTVLIFITGYCFGTLVGGSVSLDTASEPSSVDRWESSPSPSTC